MRPMVLKRAADCAPQPQLRAARSKREEQPPAGSML